MADPARPTLVCRSIMAETPTGARSLVLDVQVQCPDCGDYLVRYAGHHLRALRDFLIATIDQYPDLTAEATKVSHEHYTIETGGGDPSQN